jgi:hypothetical protein
LKSTGHLSRTKTQSKKKSEEGISLSFAQMKKKKYCCGKAEHTSPQSRNKLSQKKNGQATNPNRVMHRCKTKTIALNKKALQVIKTISRKWSD